MMQWFVGVILLTAIGFGVSFGVEELFGEKVANVVLLVLLAVIGLSSIRYGIRRDVLDLIKESVSNKEWLGSHIEECYDEIKKIKEEVEKNDEWLERVKGNLSLVEAGWYGLMNGIIKYDYEYGSEEGLISLIAKSYLARNKKMMGLDEDPTEKEIEELVMIWESREISDWNSVLQAIGFENPVHDDLVRKGYNQCYRSKEYYRNEYYRSLLDYSKLSPRIWKPNYHSEERLMMMVKLGGDDWKKWEANRYKWIMYSKNGKQVVMKKILKVVIEYRKKLDGIRNRLEKKGLPHIRVDYFDGGDEMFTRDQYGRFLKDAKEKNPAIFNAYECLRRGRGKIEVPLASYDSLLDKMRREFRRRGFP